MAEILIERRPRHRWWLWALVLIVLVVTAAATWLYMGGGRVEPAEPAPAETAPAQPERGTAPAPQPPTGAQSTAPQRQ
ncbi:MAG: hypothetical protein ACRELD_07855 [Longimicrobiales bacterium]